MKFPICWSVLDCHASRNRGRNRKFMELQSGGIGSSDLGRFQGLDGVGWLMPRKSLTVKLLKVL